MCLYKPSEITCTALTLLSTNMHPKIPKLFVVHQIRSILPLAETIKSIHNKDSDWLSSIITSLKIKVKFICFNIVTNQNTAQHDNIYQIHPNAMSSKIDKM